MMFLKRFCRVSITCRVSLRAFVVYEDTACIAALESTSITILQNIFITIAVSYTHLDVYKRQMKDTR